MTTNIGADFSSVGNVDPGARVQLRVLAEMQSPSVCACCGNGTHPLPYVDPQTYIDWHGQIYFCQTCVREMAQAIGMLDPDQSKFLLELNKNLAEENKSLKDDLDGLANIRSVLRSALADDSSIGDGATVSSEETGEARPLKAYGVGLDDVNFSGTSTESKPVKSGKVNGPNDSSRTTGRNSGLLS